MGFEARRLREPDRLDGFFSGNPDLDTYLQQFAKQNQRKQLSATWLIVDGESIAGFVTVVTGSVERSLLDDVRPRLPQYPVPALILARMAADQRFADHPVGTLLMRTVFGEAISLAAGSGCAGIYTDAKPAMYGLRSADGFYARFGFEVVLRPQNPSGTTGMFLSLKKVRAALVASPSR